MTEKATEQNIKSYLLGELPEAEVERLEESLFTDDDLLSEIEATEMSLVDGYVRNEMPQEERVRFEEQYLVTPERRQKVSDATLFHNELNAIRPMPEIVDVRTSWFERLLGSWKLPVMQYASAALILLLAISTSWLFYDGWKTRNELAMTRNSLANSETILNNRLAEKEQELNTRLAEQRGEDSDSLSTLQTEIDNLRQRLADAKRKSPDANTSIPQSPTIATIVLPISRGGINPITTATITKDTKVLNVRIPVGDDDGDVFDVAVSRDGKPVLNRAAVRAVNSADAKNLALSLPMPTAGKYDINFKSSNGVDKTRSFLVAVK